MGGGAVHATEQVNAVKGPASGAPMPAQSCGKSKTQESQGEAHPTSVGPASGVLASW